MVKQRIMGASLIGRSYSNRGHAVAARDCEITKEARENGIGFSPSRRFRYGYDSGLLSRYKARPYTDKKSPRGKMHQRIRRLR